MTDDPSELSEARRRLDARTEELLGPQRLVTIRDARAMRALAHEARQRVIEVLYADQRPRTATELAALTKLSPSAMSYHLRALERWGVVERSTDEGDARNRPWKASGTSLRIDSSDAGPTVRNLIAERALVALGRRLQAHQERPPEERAGSFPLTMGELWLTPDQAERVSLSFEYALLEEHEAGWRNEPGPGRVRMAFVWSLLPDPLPGEPNRAESPPGEAEAQAEAPSPPAAGG